MNPRISSIPGHLSLDRRRFMQAALASAAGVPLLMACSPEVTPFKSTDVTGAAFAKDFDAFLDPVKPPGEIIWFWFGHKLLITVSCLPLTVRLLLPTACRAPGY